MTWGLFFTIATLAISIWAILQKREENLLKKREVESKEFDSTKREYAKYGEFLVEYQNFMASGFGPHFGKSLAVIIDKAKSVRQDAIVIGEGENIEDIIDELEMVNNIGEWESVDWNEVPQSLLEAHNRDFIQRKSLITQLNRNQL